MIRKICIILSIPKTIRLSKFSPPTGIRFAYVNIHLLHVTVVIVRSFVIIIWMSSNWKTKIYLLSHVRLLQKWQSFVYVCELKLKKNSTIQKHNKIRERPTSLRIATKKRRISSTPPTQSKPVVTPAPLSPKARRVLAHILECLITYDTVIRGTQTTTLDADYESIIEQFCTSYETLVSEIRSNRSRASTRSLATPKIAYCRSIIPRYIRENHRHHSLAAVSEQAFESTHHRFRVCSDRYHLVISPTHSSRSPHADAFSGA